MDINWFHGLVVMTPDFDACQFSGNSGSIPDGTFFFFSSNTFIRFISTFNVDKKFLCFSYYLLELDIQDCIMVMDTLQVLRGVSQSLGNSPLC